MKRNHRWKATWLIVTLCVTTQLAAAPPSSSRESVLRSRLERSDDARWKNELASILYARGDVLEARRLWDEAAEEDANYPAADPAVAGALIAASEFEAAQVALQRATKMNPNDPHIELMRAKMAVRQENFVAAEEALQRALKRNKRLPRTLVWMGRLFELKNDVRAAESWYRKAWDADDAHVEGGRNLARIRFFRGDRKECRELLSALAQVDPDEHIPEISLATFAVQAKDLIAARTLYRTALRKQPESADLQLSLSHVLVQLKQYNAARIALETAVQLRPSVDTLLPLALLADRQGDLEAAKSAYERVLALDPRHMIANNNIAMVLIRQGPANGERALGFAKKAFDVAPDHPSVFATWTCALWESGQRADAARALPQAIRRLPADAWLRYVYGRVLLEQGDKSSAHEQLEGCLILGEDFPRKEEVQQLLETLPFDAK